jgi:leader peptidase (prepilin peptidase)/N-methyltransferase
MIEVIIAAMAGLLIGSFLNVCIYRMPRDLSVVRPRSFCPNCEMTVAWYDNIPVLSYLLLLGRCRRCSFRISYRYPLVEAITGLYFAAVATLFPDLPTELRYCVFGALLIGLVFTDIEERILPDEFTLGGLCLGLVLAYASPLPPGVVDLLAAGAMSPRWTSVADAAFSALVTAGSLWLVGTIYRLVRKRDGLGLGDVKMIAMIAAFLGLPGALLTLILGSLSGSIVGLAYIWLAKKEASSYELPFGSFLGVAAIAVVLGSRFLGR